MVTIEYKRKLVCKSCSKKYGSDFPHDNGFCMYCLRKYKENQKKAVRMALNKREQYSNSGQERYNGGGDF